MDYNIVVSMDSESNTYISKNLNLGKRIIVVMICFARSGGTILNKCLASLPNPVVKPEVKLLNDGSIKAELESPITVYEQALQ